MVIIHENDELYRGLQPDHVKPDGTITSSAFGHPRISVDLVKLLTPSNEINNFFDNHPNFKGIASITAKIPRSHKLKVCHDPLNENHAHTIIFLGKKGQPKALKRKIAKACTLVVHPNDKN